MRVWNIFDRSGAVESFSLNSDVLRPRVSPGRQGGRGLDSGWTNHIPRHPGQQADKSP